VLIPAWLMDYQPSGPQLTVYWHVAAIGLYDQGRGVYVNAYPKINTIALQTGLSRTTVKEALRWLVEIGAVIRRAQFRGNGSQTTNLYEVAVMSPFGQPDLSAIDGTEVPAGYPGRESDGEVASAPPGDPAPPGAQPTPTPDQANVASAQFVGEAPSRPGGRRPAAPPDTEPINPDSSKDAPPAGDAHANTILGDWIDYLGRNKVTLPPSMKARYGREIKDALAGHIPPVIIKKALEHMRVTNLVSKPASLPAIIVKIQTGPALREQYHAPSPTNVPRREDLTPCEVHGTASIYHCCGGKPDAN
jgi:hypothetical protein